MEKKCAHTLISLATIMVLLPALLTQIQGIGQTSKSALSDDPITDQPPSNQRGPRIDTLRCKVTTSTASQLTEMTQGPPMGSDLWNWIASPDNTEEMARQGKTVSSRSGFHYSRFVMNMRVSASPLDDVNFRHAFAHLVPKDRYSARAGAIFKYVVAKVDTPVPQAQSLWHNNQVDPHQYNLSEAESILWDAGYQKIDGEWKNKDGSALLNLRLYVPLEAVSPRDYAIGNMTVEECHRIGLNNILLTPMDFATYLDKVFNQWDFEIAWYSVGLGKFPTHLWWQFHSSNNYQGSSNPHGIVYPDLDAQLDILNWSLNHTATVSAARESQKLLMGGTTSDQLPHNVQPSDPRSQALPTVPVCSRSYYDIQQPDLRGAVNMFGYGIENAWTYMNMWWNTGPNEHRPGTSERTVVRIEPGYPERLNQLYATTAYAWDYMEYAFDGLLATNPYTHSDEPWLATSWSCSPVDTFLDITFDLRFTDEHGQPVKWQDGKPVSVYDVKFAWDFLHYWQMPNYWDSMKYYEPADTVILDSDTIRARMTTRRQWLVYDLARTAYLLPPQVWSNNPLTGAPWSSTSEILSFDPSANPYPLSGNYADGHWPGTPPPGLPSTWDDPGPESVPTQMFGTGPFKLMHSTSYISTNGYGDLAANRNYWMTVEDIQNKIEYMFWRSGDAMNDDEIDVDDIALIGKWFNSTVPPAPPETDITGIAYLPPDGHVNIDDLAAAGKYFGGTETVPYELPLEPWAPSPAIYVDPPIVTGVPPGEAFNVDIMISGAEDLYAWKAELHFAEYASSLLVEDAWGGDFLEAGGSSFFAKYIDPFHGIIKMQASLLQEGLGVNGNGWLATVRFRVLAEGESPLDLQKTILKDSGLTHLAHSSVDSHFYNINVRDIAIVDMACATTKAYPTWIDPLEIEVTVENQGTATETFDVTVYADTHNIETKWVKLTAGAEKTVVFYWNLSGVAVGTYTIKAEAEILYGETDIANNSFIDGAVRIKKPGDVNEDDLVDVFDIYAIGRAYGSSETSPGWNPQADINGDLVVDAIDLAIYKSNYGRTA